MIIRIKKKEGSALIICLVVMMFLSLLGILNFNSSRTELKISSNIAAKSVKYQASETALNSVAYNVFKKSNQLNKVLQLNPSETIENCIYNGKINTGKCGQYTMNGDGSIISYAKTTVNKDSECLAYGNSNQKANCYKIEGFGEIATLKNDEPSIHVQEIQVNSVNLSSNGVYEL